MNHTLITECSIDEHSTLSCSTENFTPAHHHLLTPPTPPPLQIPTAPPLQLSAPRRPLRVLLMGERQDVLATIQNLHKRGFADAGEWSIPLPYPQQNAVAQFIPRGLSQVVISVHTKYLS